MKISKVLHDAADKYLSNGDGRTLLSRYSCIAISSALNDNIKDLCLPWWVTSDEFTATDKIIKQGLANMGLSQEQQISTSVFTDIPKDQRQGARYLWLKWCALMAEEQGV